MKRAIHHLKKSDPVLAAIIKRVGPCRMEYGEPTFASLAEAIVYQQLNGKAALSIFNRFKDKCGGTLTPQSVLKLSEADMRAAGLSKQKLTYIRDLAQRTAAGELEFERMPEMSDEDVIAHLTRVKGIGEWTAHMFLMFTLRRPDVLPVGDFGVQMAMKKAYRKRKLKPVHMEKIAQPWRPWRSVASWYLWKSLEVKEQ